MKRNDIYKILMIPDNHAYIDNLKQYLCDCNLKVGYLKTFHHFYPIPLNLIKILICRLLGYKIIHVHWLFVFPFPWFMKIITRYCHLLGYKLIWEMHNIVAHGGNIKDVKMSKWFYDNCDGIIFHSHNDIRRSEKVLEVAVKPIKTVVYHGNFIGTYKNDVDKEQARSILGISADKRVLLCFGRIRRSRGYEYLLNAIAGMGDDIFVIIAGKIRDNELFEELLGHGKDKNLILVGRYIPDDEIQLYFNACDVVVLPYKEITTSGIVPLAYSFSRPVIVSAIGGITEVVTDETGILVPPRDTEALRDAIVSIFRSDLSRMGEEAFKYAKDNLSWQKGAANVKKFYLDVIMGDPGGNNGALMKSGKLGRNSMVPS